MYSWVSFCSIELKSTLEIRDKKEPQTIHYHTVKGTIGIHAFEIKIMMLVTILQEKEERDLKVVHRCSAPKG